jgi:hypothetical protein
MVREFDKHAGRARWDLAQRLDGVRRRFEQAMRAELDRTVEAMLAAAARADDLRAATLEERADHAERDHVALRVAQRAVGLAP